MYHIMMEHTDDGSLYDYNGAETFVLPSDIIVLWCNALLKSLW